MTAVKPHIIRRDVGKQRTKPNVKLGVVKKSLITFIAKKSGLQERWSADVVFSASRKKPLILEYKWRGVFARFYFPIWMNGNDRNDQVVNVISVWFEGLGIHDAAKPYIVQILEV